MHAWGYNPDFPLFFSAQVDVIRPPKPLDLLQIHRIFRLSHRSMSRVALVAVSLAGLASAMPFEGALEWMKEHGTWAEVKANSVFVSSESWMKR